MSIAQRVAEIRARMAAAAARAGRSLDEVRLVAVTKTHPASVIPEAAAAGILDVGENKVQEALAKQAELRESAGLRSPGHGRRPGLPEPGDLRWHLIGHLQTNKARHAVAHFDLIHSVDSERLAQALDAQCRKQARLRCDVLLQVNVSGEETKGGFEPGELPEALERILSGCPALFVEGFMTMAPFELEPEQTRPHFRRLAELAARMRERFGGHERFSGRELSMGMTNDFEIAIEEGATLVRIGSALFGARG